MMDYQTPSTRAIDNRRSRRRLSRRVMMGVGTFILIPVIAGAVLYWWDWHADHVVREWIDGPHNDPIVLLEIGGRKPMTVTIRNATSLAAINRALQSGAAGPHDAAGRSMHLRLTLHSGAVIDTEGKVSPTSITWMPLEGDLWGSWDFLTVDFGDDAPPALKEDLRFASKGNTRKD